MKKSVDLPIHHAIQKGFFQQVRFYVDQGYNVNSRDSVGRTPLALCSMISESAWAVGLARLLLENGARISLCDKPGYNALHHACINQRQQLVEILLAALDCSVLSKCRQGNTSLHFAASLGNLDIIKSLSALMVRYRMKLDPKNKQGFTPLHQAFRSNNLDCGDLLMEFGADPEIRDPSDKSAKQLREEAVERLSQIEKLSRISSAGKTVRRMKKEADEAKPVPAKEVLQIAKPFDRRNDPEYVFNMSAIDYFQQRIVKDIMGRAKSKKNKFSQSEWREELLNMWSLYETKFAASYRKPAQFVATSDAHGGRSHRGSNASPLMGKRQSRVGSKSRAASIVSSDGFPQRRISNAGSRRAGMPPLVRTQSRAAFNI